jgi:predicted lipopolysaccharide heptosyltransferase III
MQILLVRLRLIGDVVFTTPAIRAIRTRFPDARLTYLVEEAAAPVVAGNPHLDEVIAIPRTRGLARVLDDWKVGRALRARRFDLVVDFHGGPRGSWLTWLTGATERIGYTVVGRSWMYTTAVARSRELRPRHSVENQWDLLAVLGVPPPDRALDQLEMPEDAGARAEVDRRLVAAGVTGNAPIVVMHVSAGNPFRRWPVESFAAVASALVRRDPARAVVLTSGPSEREAAERAGELARADAGEAGARILRIGEVSLAELRALVGRAALYIGGDSGPLHIAGTTRTPVVGLFGPTLAIRSMPWRDPAVAAEAIEPGPLPCRPCDQRRCEPGDYRCLTGTPPERVIDAAERLLGR